MESAEDVKSSFVKRMSLSIKRSESHPDIIRGSAVVLFTSLQPCEKSEFFVLCVYNVTLLYRA